MTYEEQKKEELKKFQSGEVTVNDMRRKYGLAPIEGLDVRITTVQSDNNEASGC